MNEHKNNRKLQKVLSWMLLFTVWITSIIPGKVFADTKTARKEDSLIVYYDFSQEENALEGILDMSGHGHTGVLKCVGEEKLSDKYKIEEIDLYGQKIHGLSMSGGAEGAYLQLPSGVIDGYDTLTVSMWVRLEGDAPYQRIFDFGSGMGKYFYLLSDGRNEGHEGYATAVTKEGWQHEIGVNKAEDITNGKFALTTVVVDNDKISLFENGRQVGESVDLGYSLSSLGEFTNNYIGYGQFFDMPTEATFAEIKIYNKALTKQQILSMYEAYHVENENIESVEEIQVTTEEGCSPSLPDTVPITYKNGTTKREKVIWPVKIETSKYQKTGSFTVNGTLVGNDVSVQAEVTVVPKETTVITKQAEEFALEDITLDKIGEKGSILTQNQEREIAYLKSLDKNRMLYNFYKNYGETDKIEGVEPLAGWEEPEGLLRGHSTGRYLSAMSMAYANSKDETIKETLDEMVGELRRLQQKSKGDPAAFKTKGTEQKNWSKNPKEWGSGYIGAFPPDQFALLEQYTEYGKIWAPYYTLDKLLAGLLDVYENTNNEEALTVARELGGWVCARLEQCSKEQLKKMWSMYVAGEFGGCNESLAQLYLYTGEQRFLNGAKLFDNVDFFEALEKNVDDIANRHTNQHISQVIGAVKVYEATQKDLKPQKDYYDIAHHFWQLVTSRYAYATGGVGASEKFTYPYQQAKYMIGNTNCDTCASYNMLKLTKLLNEYTPDDASYMDYYERTLYNHILASQNPNVTTNMSAGTAAKIPVGTGAVRSYSDNENSFTCCHGAGMESPVRYQEAAYVKSDNTLYVGLYLPSTVTWKEKGVVVKQETEYPSENTKLTVSALEGTAAQTFHMKLRVPYWATKEFTVKVNGETVVTNPAVSTYVEVEHLKVGDVVEIYMPYTIHLDETPDKSEYSVVASVMYGPFVMAAGIDSTELKTLVLTENIEEVFSVSKDVQTEYPVLQTSRYSFFPMLDAKFVLKPYETYFKIFYTEDKDDIWYEVNLRNDTPKDGSLLTDTGMIKEGDNVVITAFPKEHYVVRSLLVNDVPQKMDESNRLVIKDVDQDLEIIGSFTTDTTQTDENHLEYTAVVTSDFTASWENLEGIKSDWEPNQSAAGAGKGWGNWPQQSGTEHYVQYEWEQPVTMDTFQIYWYDDGGDTSIPSGIQMVYKDTDGNWKDVSMLSSYQDITKKDTYNTIRIKPVTTTAIRMILTVREGKAATGVLRWIVCNEQKETVEEISQPPSKHNNIFTGIWEWFLKIIGKNK